MSLNSYGQGNSVSGIDEIDTDLINCNALNSTGDIYSAGSINALNNMACFGTASFTNAQVNTNLKVQPLFGGVYYSLDSSTGSMTGIGNINMSADITGTSICGVSSTQIGYVSGATSNIQNQINSLNSSIANGGGAFVVAGEKQGNFVSGTTGYLFCYGANATNFSAVSTGVILPACKLVYFGIQTSANPTSAIIVSVYKNGTTTGKTLTITTIINSITADYSASPITFALGDNVNLNVSGGVGGQGARAVMIFTTAGIQGSPANMSVGSTTTLSAGSSATVSISGAAPNYSLAFGIPQGTVGATGVCT